MASSNATASLDLPPLPPYTLREQEPLLSWIDDAYLALALPVVGYWVVSLFFHALDVFDLCPQHRLHTPAEVLARNHVSRADVLRDVLFQQVLQTLTGLLLALADGPAMVGREEYDVAVWGRRLRVAQSALPALLGLVGLDATGLGLKLAKAGWPQLGGALAGGKYPWAAHPIVVEGVRSVAPGFARWELQAARAIYWGLIPSIQMAVAVCILDTWQYFLHRAMHLNKYLYVTFHSRHHRLYVPYAYGALYNHPFEGFLLDTAGTGIAYLLTGMTVRQAMIFFTLSSVKTVDDHCGYALPWDPLQRLWPNNAAFHDIHHQSWGIKSNFSQPFFTFWDRLLGTIWTGDEADKLARYERSRRAADRKLSHGAEGHKRPDGLLQPSDSELSDRSGTASPDPIAAAERLDDPQPLRRSPRKKAQPATAASSSSTGQQGSGSLKNLRGRVNGSVHGRGGGVLGVESNH
ncbi:protein SUR2 [Lineolata rhizophorae]|uniref:Protein SUR2 n=1 Tax=Lineolata rhizophorae TaxID=578093 RepID=A0A6A6PF41_9PEZI|nr:protein SUR2 [Lineolata rhizophorae]